MYWAGYGEDFWTATTHTECAEAVDRYYNNEASHDWSDEWPEEYCIRGKTWLETCKAWADACANGKSILTPRRSKVLVDGKVWTIEPESKEEQQSEPARIP